MVKKNTQNLILLYKSCKNKQKTSLINNISKTIHYQSIKYKVENLFIMKIIVHINNHYILIVHNCILISYST